MSGDWMHKYVDVRIELAKQELKKPENLEEFSSNELEEYLKVIRGE